MIRRLLVGILALGVAYGAATAGQVWWMAHDDDRRQSKAIVVLGAAQYDGRPSPVLEARLDHALGLWHDGVAPLIVVTGGNQPGDQFTEATAAADYLGTSGVPDSAVRREVHGTSSYESLAATARFLRDEGVGDVVLVSDALHAARIGAIADELGLDAVVSPVPASRTEWTRLARESAGVAVGRLIGFRRLDNLIG